MTMLHWIYQKMQKGGSGVGRAGSVCLQAVSFAVAIGYSVLIIWLSSQGDLRLPEVGFSLNDKVLHFFEYFIFTTLWCVALQFSFPSALRPDRIWRVIFGATLFALSDEIHQAFVPGRQADVLDLVADFCGIYVGVRVFLRLAKLLGTRHPTRDNGVE